MLKKTLIFVFSAVMAISANAPVILNMKWGDIKVEFNNTCYQFKDCKLWPNNAVIWDWSKTGTRHNPGIQIDDIKEFVDQVDIVILSRGYDLILQTKSDTVKYLKSKGKEYHILQSEEAVKLYNKLVKEGKKVGIILHSTC